MHGPSVSLLPEKIISMVSFKMDAGNNFSFNTNSSFRNTSQAGTDTVSSMARDMQMIDYYISGIFTIIVIALGLLGNLLTIAVLTRRTMRSSTNCYLTALAVWDSVVLMATFFLIGVPAVSKEYNNTIKPYVLVYIYPAGLVAQTATIWLTVSFTVERYIAVCHPLKAASMCTIARARAVTMVVSVFSFVYNVSRWFEYEIVYKYDAETNSLEIVTNMTELGKSETYHKVYFLSLYLPVMCFIPLTSLAVINIFLILAVKRSQQQRRDMNVRQSRENNVTIMLVSVVIVFMICQVPALIYNIAYAINMDLVKSASSWTVLSFIRNFLVNLNSAVNFMLYCAFGQKFRRIFIRTFCRCFLSQDDFNSLTHHGTVVAHPTSIGKYSKMTRSARASHHDVMDLTSSTVATHASILSRYSRSSFDSNSVYRKNFMSKYTTNDKKGKPEEVADLFIAKGSINEQENNSGEDEGSNQIERDKENNGI